MACNAMTHDQLRSEFFRIIQERYPHNLLNYSNSAYMLYLEKSAHDLLQLWQPSDSAELYIISQSSTRLVHLTDPDSLDTIYRIIDEWLKA